MAQRIQRKFGQMNPGNTAYVGNGSGWANPFKAGETKILRADDGSRIICSPSDEQDAVEHFRWFMGQGERVQAATSHLAGKDLMCWCPLDQPCHADVLLELANGKAA